MNQTLVIGNRWSAIGIVAYHVLAQKKVDWLYPTTGKFWDVLPYLNMSQEDGFESGVQAWKDIFIAFNLVSSDEFEQGHFLREFKNKSFRTPGWVAAPTPEERLEVRLETLFGPEKRMCPYTEGKFEESFAVLIERLKNLLMEHPLVELKRDVIISKIEESIESNGFTVDYSDQSTMKYAEVYCADELEKTRQFFQSIDKIMLNEKTVQWSDLLRQWNLGGMIQIEFTHTALPDGLLENGWILPLTRESYEKQTRHALGYFLHEEKKSRWSIFITAEEQENNQEISKKIRRLKQALAKSFSSEDFFAHSGLSDWQSTIIKENVVLIESCVSFSEKINSGLLSSVNKNAFVFYDIYGPEIAISMVFNSLSKRAEFNRSHIFSDVGPISQSKDSNALSV